MKSIPEIIFQNSHIIVVDKPCGALSVPSRMGKEDPRPVVGILLQDYLKQQIFPVHRLDEETSGLLVFAKTPQAQSLLSRAFELHEVQKTYQALTERQDGYEGLQGSTLKNKLFRGKKRSFEADHGQLAETLVQQIEPYRSSKLLLWTLLPKTGRSHQLRVQLALRGFPIVGDTLYGSKSPLPAEFYLPEGSQRNAAIGLRASTLDFTRSKGFASLEAPSLLKVKSW